MSTKIKVLNIGSEVTLPNAEHVRETLQKSINTRNITIVDISRIEEMDLSGVQLLYAARRYAESKKKEFHLTGFLPEHLTEMLYRSGFVTEPIAEGRTLENRLHEFRKEESTDA